MPVSYNLKYRKCNYLNRQILEKEGEILIDRDFFTLRGKGAKDQGERISFTNVKDVYLKGDQVTFSTLAKEKYYLSEFKNLEEPFIADFLKARNQIMISSLFLGRGEMTHEFDGAFQYFSKFGKLIRKGQGKLRFYENSLVIIPDSREAFSIPFDFFAKQDLDEINYEITITLESGKKIIFSHLQSMFDDFQDTLDRVRERMYTSIVTSLRTHLPEFDAGTILKVAALMRGGKATPLKEVKKISPDLWDSMSELLFPTDEAKATFKDLSALAEEDNIYVGFRDRPNHKEDELPYIAWFLVSIPEKNVIAMEITSEKQLNTLFFKIIMEQGQAQEKDKERIHEINQTLLTFDFNTKVLYRDRRDLKKTKYRLALFKIPFLRSLRKAYLGHAYYKTEKDWKHYLNLLIEKSQRKAKKKKH